MDIFSQLWNLVTSSLRVFLIVSLAAGLALYFPGDIKSLDAIRIALFIGLSGASISILHYLWVNVPLWITAQRVRVTSKERQKEIETTTLKSIPYLTKQEKAFLKSAINSADDTGLFRREDRRFIRDEPSVNDNLTVLRERKIVAASNEAQALYHVGSILFWRLTPIVLQNRTEVLAMLD